MNGGLKVIFSFIVGFSVGGLFALILISGFGSEYKIQLLNDCELQEDVYFYVDAKKHKIYGCPIQK